MEAIRNTWTFPSLAKHISKSAGLSVSLTSCALEWRFTCQSLNTRQPFRSRYFAISRLKHIEVLLLPDTPRADAAAV